MTIIQRPGSSDLYTNGSAAPRVIDEAAPSRNDELITVNDSGRDGSSAKNNEPKKQEDRKLQRRRSKQRNRNTQKQKQEAVSNQQKELAKNNQGQTAGYNLGFYGVAAALISIFIIFNLSNRRG